MTSMAMVARLGVRNLLQNSRQYSRKVVRRPLRVLGEEEAVETSRLSKLRPFVEESISPNPSQTEQQEAGYPAILEGESSRLPAGFPPYEKKGNDDTDLSRLVFDSSSKKKRQQSGLIMLEGKRLVQEAFNAKLKPKALFFSRVEDVTSLQLPPRKFAFQKVTYDKMKRYSKLITPPGVIGFFQMPDLSNREPVSVLPFSIICDNIRDPGNLGSLLRVAASAGCKKVYLTKGCVDLWNDKVLRSGMGSHFHLCIKENMEWFDIEKKLEPDAYIMFADNKDVDIPEEIVRDDIFHESQMKSRKHAVSQEVPVLLSCADARQLVENLPVFPYYLVDYSQINMMYVLIGGETGLSSNAANFGKAHKKFRINIPMLNNVESLNVSSALAILTHEIKRQLQVRQSSYDPSEHMDSVPVPNM